MSAISKLINISSDPISNKKILTKFPNVEKLDEILSLKNGFQAFGGAFRMLSADVDKERNILSWNCFLQSVLNDDKFFFFADSILGDGFCFFENDIFKYDFECGDLEFMGASLSEFSQKLLSEYSYYTGYSILKLWEEENGALSSDQILMPVTPFCLGGEFALFNLYETDIFSGVKTKNYLNNQIKYLDDGELIRINLI